MRIPDFPRRAVPLLVALCLLAAFGPVGCGMVARTGKGLASAIPLVGGKKSEGPEIGPEGAQVPLGEVSFVDVTSRFVLVRTGRTIKLKTGAPLEARRELERVAELSFSPEFRQGFLVADILRGNPMIGDVVMTHSSEIVDMVAARQRSEARETAYKKAVKDSSKKRGLKRLLKK